ncbi:hypothetical protein [Trinickia violacea]|uniref:hypothetical protein n=1 Tax=Trinickia violacea TaxID=2571746 RepID=UPI0015860239|nr:hypothetical protein [Trinickia violacea]
MRDNVSFMSGTPALQTANETITNYLTHGGAMTPDTNGGVETDIFKLLKLFGDSHSDLRYVYFGTKWGGDKEIVISLVRARLTTLDSLTPHPGIRRPVSESCPAFLLSSTNSEWPVVRPLHSHSRHLQVKSVSLPS